MLEVKYSNQAEDFLRKAEKVVVKRLMKKIEELANNPFSQGIKSVEGYKERIFRIRVGDYRILYEVDQNSNLLGIVKIDKRSRVY
ncbi:MAG: type II toxin-antitoxin system RelE/ParE family toxin [Candidatus Aenigmarchaeota archaeon]|nr:type II toxin-antitoxin system RelE/ParE family toxin [Candidatus Aenigmarchaeota archaeon]